MRDIIEQFPQLKESVSSLSDIARNNPHTIEDVIRLAMLIALHQKIIQEERKITLPLGYFAGIDWGKK